MFEENGKFADELVFCKDIKEDETGKTYTFENGETIHLDKDTKICSDLIDRKVKTVKNGKYGAVVLYNNSIIKEYKEEIDNIEKEYKEKKDEIIKEYDYSMKEINNKERRLNEELKILDNGLSNVNKEEKEYFDELNKYLNLIIDARNNLEENYKKFFNKELDNDISLSEERISEINRKTYGISDYIENDICKPVYRIRENIDSIRNRKKEKIQNRENNIKKANEEIDKANEIVKLHENSIKEIETLIEHIGSNDIEYINNFVKNLKDNQNFDDKFKTVILMALNDEKPFVLNDYDKYCINENEKFDYYYTSILITTPSYKGLDLTKEALNLKTAIIILNGMLTRERDNAERAVYNFERIDKAIKEFDEEIEKNLLMLNETIIESLKKLDMCNEEVLERKERYLHGKMCTDTLNKYAKFYQSHAKLYIRNGVHEYNGNEIIINEIQSDSICISINGIQVYNSSRYNSFNGDYDDFEKLVNFFNYYIDNEKKKINDLKQQEDKNLEEKLDNLNSEKYEKISFYQQKIDKGYNEIEPKYDKVNVGEGYINALEQDEFYLFNGYGNLEVERVKRDDFKLINESTIYNGGLLYDCLLALKGDLIYSEDKERIYFLNGDKFYFAEEYIPSLIVYSSDGKELNRYCKSQFNNYPDMETTSDNRIIFRSIREKEDDQSRYFNVDTGKYSSNGYISDFVGGHAFFSTLSDNREIVTKIIDTNFDAVKEVNFYPVFSKDSKYHYQVEKNHMPISIFKKTKNGEIEKYGYSDFDGNIVVPCKYKTTEDARKEFEKYLKSKEKKDKKVALKEEKKKLKEIKKGKVDLEPIIDKNSNNDIYELEDKIKVYLSKMNMPKLEIKFRLMQRDYQSNIKESSKQDIEKRKNLILNNSNLLVSNSNSSKLVYKNYKNELNNFLKQLEDNYFIVDILDKINIVDKLISGEAVNSKDDLIQDVSTLLDLYSNLDDKSKKRITNSLKNNIKDEKEYFENYFFRKNYKEKCKYNSYNEWEKSFRTRLQEYIIQFKREFEFKQVSDNIKNIEEAKESLKENRYKSVLIYCNEIKNIVNEIKSQTNDNDILKELKKYEEIDIDYNKSPEENINYILGKLKDILKYQKDVEYILESNELSSYSTNRNTK